MYKHEFGEAVAVWVGRLDWSWPLGGILRSRRSRDTVHRWQIVTVTVDRLAGSLDHHESQQRGLKPKASDTETPLVPVSVSVHITSLEECVVGRIWSWPLGEFLDRVDRATQYTGDKS